MSSEERVLVPLAEGFEEMEAVAIVDVLRRGGLEVVTAGLAPGRVTGAHGIAIEPDAELGALELDRFTAVVLPGGMPGTRNLMADERLLALIRRLHGEERTTAAICAAPLVLQAAGVLGAGPATSHPSVRGELVGCELVDEPRVVTAGAVVTSQGPGTAIEFGLALVERFVGPEKAAELGRAMLVRA